MNEDNRFLPGFDVAPPENMRLLDELGIDASGVTYQARPAELDKRQAIVTIAARGRVARAIGGLPFQGEAVYEHTVESWEELIDGSRAWARSHFEHLPLSEFGDKAQFIEATEEGIATIGAFLEVIPRILFNKEFEAGPNGCIDAYANRSVRFISEWMRIDGEVDPNLAFALSERKPKQFANVFHNLRFNARWFVVDETAQQIRLDPDKALNLRGYRHRNHPMQMQPPAAALFACPARKMIPRLYQTMRAQAYDSGLFGQTYENERSNHGYV